MPDAKDNAKASGDVHPPEVERMDGTSPAGRPQVQGADGTPPDDDYTRDIENQGRAGKKVEQAGYLKDKDAPGLGGKKS